MKLKDILELGTYGYNPECKVEFSTWITSKTFRE